MLKDIPKPPGSGLGVRSKRGPVHIRGDCREGTVPHKQQSLRPKDARRTSVRLTLLSLLVFLTALTACASHDHEEAKRLLRAHGITNANLGKEAVVPPANSSCQINTPFTGLNAVGEPVSGLLCTDWVTGRSTVFID